MVQMFYYENHGKCCKTLWKHDGKKLKVSWSRDPARQLFVDFFVEEKKSMLMMTNAKILPAEIIKKLCNTHKKSSAADVQ